MRNGFLLAAVVVLALLTAGPAHAAKRTVVGIGDQKAQMFEDQRFKWLGVRHARLVVPWYVATPRTQSERLELTYVTDWLGRARSAGVTPVVVFGHGFVGKMRTYLPKAREFRRSARAFRKKFPWVREYLAWNEANHCSQPTCKRPARAAQYFDTLRGLCRKCTVVAPAVLDQPNMVRWLRSFRRAAKTPVRTYALHNYLDVNRLRSTGTRRFLRAIPRRAKVWVTETGGVVKRQRFRGRADFPENATRAGRVVSYALRLARRQRKITRVYLYHWNIHKADASWDSGLIDMSGGARPGFGSLARFRGKDPSQAPAGTLPPPPANQPPISENRPPAETQSSNGSGGQQQEQPPPQEEPPPEEPKCPLPVCVPSPPLDELGALLG